MLLLYDAVDLYIRLHLSTQRRPKPAIALLRRHIPLLPNKPLAELERFEVMAWRNTVGVTAPASANKVVGLLGHCYVFMKEGGKYSGENPCAHIKRLRRPKRQRVVQPGAEMTRLIAAIGREANLWAKALVLIALYTGLRKMEICSLMWEHFDVLTGRGVHPNAKGGKAYKFNLPAEVLALLKKLPRNGPFVLATKSGKPWTREWADYHWQRIRARAGLDDVHFHDLRRTYGSWLDMMGVPLQKISKLLNHSDVQTTQIYIGGIDLTDQDQPITAALAKRIQTCKEAM